MDKHIANISQKNQDKLLFCGFKSQEEIDGIVNDLLEKFDPEDYLSFESDDEIYVDKEYDDDYLTTESDEIYPDTFDEADNSHYEGSLNNNLDYEIKKAIEEICAMENIDSEVEDELEKILIMLEEADRGNEKRNNDENYFLN